MARAAALEEALETLRIHHEKYFLGLIRKPPTEERGAVRSAILKLKSGFVRNTAVRFRVASLHNRYLSYERMWDRTLREMEEGTYRRDLFKARLRRAEVEDPIAKRAGATAAGARPPDDGANADAEGAAPSPASAAASGQATDREVGAACSRVPAGAPVVAAGLDDTRIRELHAAYVEARRRCSERTDGVTVESVGNALRKQLPALLAKHGARSMEFRVSIQDGKAVLKAFPK